MVGDLGLGLIVSLKDAFSRNAARIQSSMTALDQTVADASERMNKNLGLIQKGTMMIGAGFGLMALPAGLIASTVATQRSLAEMSSLGTKDLKALEDAAESFTNQWAGYSKAEFIGAAYDVKSALANLSDEAVGTFSAMAALTAKATKASIQEMVGTFTTGYGIYKPIMQDMTDMEWAQVFSGGIAQTVAAFKTTGKEMADAIKNIGALAAASNVPLEEQLAILGQLQTTMPGSEAGTMYKAFMMKAAEAGQKLGLSFVDSTGSLKGIVPILEEIQEKFPDLSQAKAQMQIKEAFGSDEAVRFLLQMAQGMDTLDGNIKSIADAMAKGTAVTEEMAKAMNMDIGSQFMLLKQQLGNLFEIMGRTLIPVVTPLIHGISKFILALQGIAKSMPGVVGVLLALSMALGAVLVAVGGVVAAAGTIGLMMPVIEAGLAGIGAGLAAVGSAVATYFLPVVAIIGGVILAVYLLKRAWDANFGGIRDTVVGLWDKVRTVFEGLKALITSLKGGVGQMSAELAKKLEDMGLMGLVTTIFRVYYRLQQYAEGYRNAMSHAFSRVNAILGPAVKSLVNAFMALWKALFSVTAIFTRTANAADASSYKTLGQVLGTVFGVILQIGAFALKSFFESLTLIVRIVAIAVRAIVWLATTIVTGVVESVKLMFKFFLPLRMLVQALWMVGRIAYQVWRILSGDVSVFGGILAIGKAVLDYLLTPFKWVWDIVKTVFQGIVGVFQEIGRVFMAGGRAMVSLFMGLPIVKAVKWIIDTLKGLTGGEETFFQAGKRMLTSFASGVWSAATAPFQMLKRALGWLRRLLPFSDAQEGPLSDVTASGAALLQSLARGMLGVLGLPARLLGMGLSALVGVGRRALAGLSATGEGILSAVTWPFRRAGEILSSLWNGVTGVVSGAWGRITALGRGAVDAVLSPFRWVADQARSVLGGIRGAATSLWEGLQNAGRSAWTAVTAPFRWVAETASSVWGRVTSAAGSAWEGLVSTVRTAGSWLVAPFVAVGDAVSGVVNRAASMWNGLLGLGESVWTRLTSPFTQIADAATDAWSRITGGATTFWAGLKSMADRAGDWLRAPFQAMGKAMETAKSVVSGVVGSVPRVLSGVRDLSTGLLGTAARGLAVPSMVSALSLTPLLPRPNPFLPGEGFAPGVETTGPSRGAARTEPGLGPQPVTPAIPGFLTPTEPYRPELLAETRGSLAPGGAPSGDADLRSLVEAILSKMDSLAERPIDLTVTTQLDGRRIAQSVYKDLRERKIKNYETL